MKAVSARREALVDARLERARLTAAVFDNLSGQALFATWLAGLIFDAENATTGEEALRREGKRELLRMIQQDLEIAEHETVARKPA